MIVVIKIKNLKLKKWKKLNKDNSKIKRKKNSISNGSKDVTNTNFDTK